jgi:hypothetical protein
LSGDLSLTHKSNRARVRARAGARKLTFVVIEPFNIMGCPFVKWAKGQTIETTTQEKTWILDHEKLDVYQIAIEFVVLADKIVEHLPRGRSYVSDQLHRAALSIPLNVAEGVGEYAVEEKIRFYRWPKDLLPSVQEY